MESKLLRRISGKKEVTTKMLLKVCTLKDIVLLKENQGKLRDLVAINESTSITKALETMRDVGVNTLVLFSHVKGDEKRVYKSMVTSLDILNWFTWKTNKSDSDQVTIGELSGFTEETKTLWSYPVTLHLDSFVQPFMQGVHSILVLYKNDKKQNVFISQWDVINFIFTNRKFLKESCDLFDETIEDSSIINRLSKVKGIDCNEIIQKATEIMCKEGYNGVPIVNENEILISNLKASHAKQILEEERIMKLPIEKFLKGIGEPIGPKNVQNAVKMDTKINDVLELAVKKHFKQFWLVDEEGRPHYVITLSDLIREFNFYDFYKEYGMNSD